MYSDSITANTSNSNAIPVTSSSSDTKDFSKKKRGNKSAKLKQCKLDARREQWLSQVKQKRGKEKSNGGSSDGSVKHLNHMRGGLVEKLEMKSRGEEEIDGGSVLYSGSESSSNSPTSHTSSILGGKVYGTTLTGSSISRSSSCSGGCYSGNVSEEHDDCWDDWEAMADALAAIERKQEDQKSVLDSAPQNSNSAFLECHPEVTDDSDCVFDASPENHGSIVQLIVVHGDQMMLLDLRVYPTCQSSIVFR